MHLPHKPPPFTPISCGDMVPHGPQTARYSPTNQSLLSCTILLGYWHSNLRSSSNSPHRTKLSSYKRPGNLQSLLSSSRNLIPLLPIPIFTSIAASIEEPKGRDTPLSHSTIYSKPLIAFPFTKAQDKLSIYVLLIPFNNFTTHIIHSQHLLLSFHISLT